MAGRFGDQVIANGHLPLDEMGREQGEGHMMVAVVSDLVSRGGGPCHQVPVATHAAAHYEECGGDALGLQHVQEPGRDVGVGTVIEGQRDPLLGGVEFAQQLPAQVFSNLLNFQQAGAQRFSSSDSR